VSFAVPLPQEREADAATREMEAIFLAEAAEEPDGHEHSENEAEFVEVGEEGS